MSVVKRNERDRAPINGKMIPDVFEALIVRKLFVDLRKAGVYAKWYDIESSENAACVSLSKKQFLLVTESKSTFIETIVDDKDHCNTIDFTTNACEEIAPLLRKIFPELDLGKNYLTEDKLAEHLKAIFPDEVIIRNKKIQGLSCNGRPDFYIPSKKLIVEFDGNRHYQQATVILKDREKERIYTEAGLKVVRIPYFIQWCSELVKQEFGIDIEIVQEYPHGFIDENAILPCDFNEMGVQKFIDDTFKFDFCYEEILLSLIDNDEIMPRAISEMISERFYT